MTTAGNPWGNPEPEPPPLRPSPILIVLLAILPIAGYFVGTYIERRTHSSPQARLELAIQTLRDGYDDSALKLFQALADEGNAKAQFHLAIMYEHGWGTPADPKRAVELYTKAAQQALTPAETRLGDVYLHGTVALQDVARARTWYEKAARAGSNYAEQQLGDIYERGLGVAANPIEAYAWNAVAAAKGNKLAASQRDRILQAMPPDVQAKAAARATALEVSIREALTARTASSPPKR
jgi:TPR repeat protein